MQGLLDKIPIRLPLFIPAYVPAVLEGTSYGSGSIFNIACRYRKVNLRKRCILIWLLYNRFRPAVGSGGHRVRQSSVSLFSSKPGAPMGPPADFASCLKNYLARRLFAQRPFAEAAPTRNNRKNTTMIIHITPLLFPKITDIPSCAIMIGRRWCTFVRAII
jgi:hypothetical protein